MTVETRPWGSFETLFGSYNWKVKILRVNPRQRISLQRHKMRREIWTVVDGVGNITVGRAVFSDCRSGFFTCIGLEEWHRVFCSGEYPLVIVETQIGVCDEEDIERMEDDYGRS